MEAKPGLRVPPAREKSPQELERERICRVYDAAHPKVVEIDDPDDPRYYMDSDEMREFERKKLAAEKGKTQQDHRKEVMEKIYAKHNPAPEPEEENPFDDRDAAHRAVDSFLDKNPEYRKESTWRTLTETAEKSLHDDVIALRKKAYASESPADIKKWLDRAAEVAPGEKELSDRKAAVARMAMDRFANRCKP